MLRKFKVLLVALVVLLVACSTYAFAAANTIAPSAAGYLASTVSGFDITNVIYDLHTGNPTLLDKIIFNIAPQVVLAGDAVSVYISTTTVPDFSTSTCVIVPGTPTVATCTFTAPITVASVVKLDIIATSSSNP